MMLFGDSNRALALVINDQNDYAAENAWSAWGESKIFTLIYVGSKRPPTIDVLGHEYTHAVERSISHLEGKGETGGSDGGIWRYYGGNYYRLV